MRGRRQIEKEKVWELDSELCGEVFGQGIV